MRGQGRSRLTRRTRVTLVAGALFVIGTAALAPMFPYLEAGCIVPWHDHENEQLSYVLSGAVRFRVGDPDGAEVLVQAGEILHIPSGVPHGVVAVVDSVSLDIFSPPRQDWLDGTDDYLRRAPGR